LLDVAVKVEADELLQRIEALESAVKKALAMSLRATTAGRPRSSSGRSPLGSSL
jgi:hypothetical protein